MPGCWRCMQKPIFSNSFGSPRVLVEFFRSPERVLGFLAFQGQTFKNQRKTIDIFPNEKNQGKSWNFPILQSKQKIQGERSMFSKIKTTKEKIKKINLFPCFFRVVFWKVKNQSCSLGFCDFLNFFPESFGFWPWETKNPNTLSSNQKKRCGKSKNQSFSTWIKKFYLKRLILELWNFGSIWWPNFGVQQWKNQNDFRRAHALGNKHQHPIRVFPFSPPVLNVAYVLLLTPAGPTL